MENNKCSHHNCELEVYESRDKCVLHCKKDNIYRHLEHHPFYITLDTYLKDKNREAVLILNYICFPPHDDRDSFDYEKILSNFTLIHFQYCEFYTSDLELNREKTKCFFQDCIFHNRWTLYNYDVLTNMDDVLYQACLFKKNVSNYSYIDTKEEYSLYKTSLFDYTTKFEKALIFNNVKLKKPLFYSAQNNYLEENFIKRLIFNNCIFEQPFKLNDYKIDNFICEDTTFIKKSKFEFKNNEVNKFEIRNTNFSVLVDCFETKFQSFYVEKSIFEKFTGFEKCKFGEFKQEENIVTFEYATFLNFVNFRDAKFYSGLDLRNGNFKESLNFLDVQVEPSKIENKITNRETFRIIKHSFDSVGNLIEANKFFAYEMIKEREEPSNKNKFYKWILDINYFISNFGQSWLTPFLLIIYFLCLQFLVFCLMDDWKFDDGLLRDFWIGLNHTIQNFMPLKKFLVEGKEFVSLLFLIVYSTLVYNLIIAIKRITKR